MLRSSKLVALGMVVVVSAIGCGGEEEGPSSQDGVSARAEAMLGPVESALEQPTGVVDAGSVRAVLASSQAQGALSAAAPYAPIPGYPGATPQGPGDYSACVDSGPTGGTMDMACLSDGLVTGTLVYEVAQNGANSVYFVMEYVDVCAEGTCADGTVAMNIRNEDTSSEIVAAGEIDVVTPTDAMHVEYGFRWTQSGDSMTYESVAFDDEGNSYVVTASTNGEAGTFTVTGSNGSFTCSYDAGGETGTCTGSNGGTFAW